MSMRKYWQRLRKTLERGRTKPRPRTRQLRLEELESRTVPSTILWTNRGVTSGADNDRFNDVFGANAEAARRVADAVLRSWQNMILSFNYSDVGLGDTYRLKITMDTATGFGARGGPTAQLNGKPTQGAITIQTGSDASGTGWWLDPTPDYYEEFRGNIINPYVGNPSPSITADFYSIVMAEMGHCMGLTDRSDLLFRQDPNHYLTNTGIDDTVDTPGKLWTFHGPNGDNVLFTSNNGGSGGTDRGAPVHVARPSLGNQVTRDGITYYGAEDPDNASGPPQWRILLSNLDADVLRDVYSYTVIDPTDSMYINYNPTTRNLWIHGGTKGENIYPSQNNPSDDNISVGTTTVGGQTYVSAQVVIGNPVPGTAEFGFSFEVFTKLFPVADVGSITIDGGDGNDRVDVYTKSSTAPISVTNSGNLSVFVSANGGPVTINGTGPSTKVNVGDGGHLTNILADVSVSSTAGPIDLTVDNSSDPDRRTVSLSDTTISFGGPQIRYPRNGMRSLTLKGGYGGGSYAITDTPTAPTTLRTRGSNTVLVQGNSSQLNVDGQDSGDFVQISNSRGLENMRAPVSVTNSQANGTFLVVSNDADSGNLAVTLGPTQISFGGPAISYAANALSGLQVLGGTGTSTYTINGTPNTGADGVFVQTKGNGDRVRVLANTSPVFVNGVAPNRVEVGDNGRLTNVFRDISVSPTSVATDLVSDDSADTTGRTVTITNNAVSYGNPSALLRYSKLASLTVRGGSGDTFNILGTVAGATTTVNAGAGSNTVNVGNVFNRLEDLRGPLTVNSPAGTTTLNVKDQGTSSDKFYEIYADAVKRVLNPNPKTYDAVINYTNIGTLTVTGGSGENVFHVESTAAGTSTTVNGGSGTRNDFAAAGSNGGLLGPLAVHGGSGPINTLVYRDFEASAAQTYTLTANMVSRTGAADVTFDNLIQVILAAASVGGNTINVPSVAAGLTAAFNPGNGDTITIGANQTLAAVRGRVAVSPGDNISANVVIDDSSNATPPAGPITLSNDVTYGFSISGLTPEVIYLSARQNTNLNTSLRTGAGNKTFNVQAAPQGVALSLDAGSSTNTLDYTGYTGNVLANLQLGVATGFSSIANVQNVTGASGGPAGSYNVLIGNGGNVLRGGNGRRNLLVAGASASTLIGGDQDDVLIAGTTDYDTSGQWQAAFTAIMNEWTQATAYATRVGHLLNGGGLNDPYRLNAATVHSNGGGNTLTGHGGGAAERNLYFANLALGDVTDQDPGLGEQLISIV